LSTSLKPPPPPEPAGSSGEGEHDPLPAESGELRPLPTPVRIFLYFLGWLLIIVGLLGLVLPGIQGILTMVLGAAILSLASEAAHRRLRSVLERWPRSHRMMERFRAKVHGWLSKD